MADARFDEDPLLRLKGILEDLLGGCGWARPAWTSVPSTEAPPWSHPGRCLVGSLAAPAGIVATLAPLDPALARKLGLSGELSSDVACAEVSIDALLAAPRRAQVHAPIPRFPAVKVDVAASLPQEIEAIRCVDAIEKAGKGWVASTELFDVYAGPNLGPGRKSLAFHVTLAAADRTLSEQDLARFLERFEGEVRKLGGELRRA
jgi:phenylalanyl-tRNA synthetase beta chain